MSEEGTWPEVPLIFNDLPLEGGGEAHFQFEAYADGWLEEAKAKVADLERHRFKLFTPLASELSVL